MVLNETEDCNTVGLWYPLWNQDKHSTVIPLSTSLLIQSIPNFKEVLVLSHLKAYVIFFPLLVLFPISVLTLLKVHCCSSGEVGYRVLGWLQAAGWQTALCLCNSPALFWAAFPFPQRLWGGMTQGRILAALPSLSTTWVMCSRDRSEPAAGYLGAAGCLKAGLGCLSCGCALIQSSKLGFG